jgi:hypothetical protein
VKRPALAFLSFDNPLWLPVWLASLALGCGGDPPHGTHLTFDACAPLVVVPEPTITAEQSQGLADGIALWNSRAATRISGALPAVDDAPAQVPLRFQAAAPPFHGLYDDQAGIVFINQDVTDRHALAVTIAHELGHVFGLPHVATSVRASLMNAGNMTVEPTPADVATLADRWGPCGP